MKRVSLATILVVLVVSGVAVAAKQDTYTGKDKDKACGAPPFGCQITIGVDTKKGKPSKVATFTFLGVPAGKCHGGEAFFEDADSSRETPVKIAKDRTFKDKFGFGLGVKAPNTAHIEGKFSKDFKKVTGTLRLTGTSSNFDSGSCDSGTDSYSAKRK